MWLREVRGSIASGVGFYAKSMSEEYVVLNRNEQKYSEGLVSLLLVRCCF